jgi:hypothetical protein
VVYSGLDELYYDCRVRQYDEEKFLERLELLLKGETINNWNEICDNKTEKDFQFKLGVNDETIEQRSFLMVVNPI